MWKERSRQYQLPKAVEPIVDKQIQEWLESGSIVPSKAEAKWNSALMVAFRNKQQLLHQKALTRNETSSTGHKPKSFEPPKPRVCMDLRHINNILDLDSMTKDLPIPRIQEIYEKVKGFKYASTLDLCSANQ